MAWSNTYICYSRKPTAAKYKTFVFNNSVRRPDLITQEDHHSWMFNNSAPLAIREALKQLFPGIDDYEAIALGMDGLSDAYLIDDPANPSGPKIIDPIKDSFAQGKYYQSISQAISTNNSYRLGNSGTSFC